MCQWHRNIQRMIDEIDACIRREDDEASTLSRLAGKLGYSESYVSRKFRELSGMRLREYLCGRRLAFALRDLRCGGNGILDIALKYGYSSPTSFNRAFQSVHGVAPSKAREGALNAWMPMRRASPKYNAVLSLFVLAPCSNAAMNSTG